MFKVKTWEAGEIESRRHLKSISKSQIIIKVGDTFKKRYLNLKQRNENTKTFPFLMQFQVNVKYLTRTQQKMQSRRR